MEVMRPEWVKGRAKRVETKNGDSASQRSNLVARRLRLAGEQSMDFTDRWIANIPLHLSSGPSVFDEGGETSLVSEHLPITASLEPVLSRMELMVASGKDWVWARRLMTALFWLCWMSLVSIALLFILRTPDCKPLPKLHWWYDGPMYQIATRSFQDSNGDGNGDLTGIKQRLNYIKMLHMRAVIIGPIHEYKPDDRNSTNLKSIDMIYGNMQDFKYLIKLANTQDIKVLIDLTPNPLGTKLNKWFNIKFDDKEQNEILEDFNFWLRSGVDGIFVSLSADEIEPSAFIDSLKRWKEIDSEYSTTRKPRVVAVCLEGTLPSDFVLDQFSGYILFIYSIKQIQIVQTNHFTKLMAQAFSRKGMELIGLLFRKPYEGHIISSVHYKLKRLIACIMFSLPGTPIIYYGDEIGLQDYKKSVFPLMQWNNSKYGGFTFGSPWITPDENISNANIQQLSDDPHSLLSYYKQLGLFKKELVSLKYGFFRMVFNETNYLAYTRQRGNKGVLVVLNFGSTIHIDFTAGGLPLTSLLILSSSLGLQCQIVNMKNLTVPSLEAYILKYYILS